MRCISPRTVGFLSDGKTLSWSPKKSSKEFATFQLPCGKCRYCRLEYARQWAVRCVHEAEMHKENSFITLTYDDQHLKSSTLQYKDFQDFMKRLRKSLHNQKISYFVTGEYGEHRKRPHWHAIIFGWRPSDTVYKYSNSRGDKLFSSDILNSLWTDGICEVGNVTFESAGYCARYAAKKLVHGSDQEHEYHPISKKSSHSAIGKKWLEKFYKDVFDYGELRLPNGKTCSIPRYYEKWLLKNKPSDWRRYVTQMKVKNIQRAVEINDKMLLEWQTENWTRGHKGYTLTHLQRQKIILDEKLKSLTNRLDKEL